LHKTPFAGGGFNLGKRERTQSKVNSHQKAYEECIFRFHPCTAALFLSLQTRSWFFVNQPDCAAQQQKQLEKVQL
jgi:hypothetical protein